MVHLPRPSHVIARFRWVAYIFCAAWATVVIVMLTRGMATMYSQRETPPTSTSTIDGRAMFDGVTRWGPMPNIMMTWYGGCFKDATLGHPWGYDLEQNFYKANNTEPSVLRSANNNAVFINVSMLFPRFDGKSDMPAFQGLPGGGGSQAPYLSIHIAGGGVCSTQLAMNLWLLPHDEIVDSETLRPSNPGNATYYGQLRLKGINTQNMIITKTIGPASGVFWGWPWEPEHTRVNYKLALGYTENLWAGTTTGVYLWIWVPDSQVTKSAPVGLLKQFVQLLAESGGTITIFNMIFYFIFVRKYKPTEEEKSHSALTLKFHGGQEHPAKPGNKPLLG